MALMEIYAIPEIHRAHANEYFIKDLYSQGLVDRQDKLCAVTQKGRAHIEQLTSLGLPRQGWVTAKGDGLITWEGA